MSARPRPVGINHVALEVGDLEAAVAFYTGLFAIDDVEHEPPAVAFLGMGDQFIALVEVADRPPDTERHFGLVVDDREAVRVALEAAGIAIIPPRLDFRDPWGNRVQVVDYRDIRFTKAPGVLRGMGLAELGKRPGARRELADAGLLPDDG